MIYGYLRGSTGEIDKNNQRKSIEKYAKDNDYKVSYIDDTVSSGKPYKEREIYNLVSNLRADDVVIVAELSRLARNVEESLTISREVIERQASIIILNPKLEMKAESDIMAKMMLNIMSMSAEMERYFIRSRTKLSLQQRKEQIKEKGFFINKSGEKCYTLGTPKGAKKRLKLDDKIDEIHGYLLKELSQSAIAKIYGVNRHTIAKLLKRYPLQHQQTITQTIRG
jgi:DNA invertase Pin-like site-specific DNA recombinase